MDRFINEKALDNSIIIYRGIKIVAEAVSPKLTTWTIEE